jgi:hypothetical protein
MKKITLLSCILFLSAFYLQAATIYLVDNSVTSGPISTGWRTALSGETNVHLDGTAFNAWYAATTFAVDDQVWLLSDANKYILTAVVTLKINGKIYGGFKGTETVSTIGVAGGRELNSNPAGNWDLKYPSILDGAGTYQGITGGGPTILIDGITVQNCYRTAGTQAAGIFVTSSAIVQNCIVTNCTSTSTAVMGNGASSAIQLNSGAKLVDSYIHSNTFTDGGATGKAGGAVAILAHANYNYGSVTSAISGCKISNNTTTAGSFAAGGLYMYAGNIADGFKNLQILNCDISNNTTTGTGGGISIYYISTTNNTVNAPVVIKGCTFDSNKAKNTLGGGAICFIVNNTNVLNNVTIQNSTFKNNVATSTGDNTGTSYHGSAINTQGYMTINNCLIASNVGLSAIAVSPTSGILANINNCTIANNVNTTPAAVMAIFSNIPVTASTITNTIFYNQTATPLYVGTGGVVPTTTYCGFDNNVTSTSAPYNGTGNINTIAASSFVGGNNYHLVAGSTAINAGTTIAACNPDLDNVSRPQGTSYCMGAYEFNDTSTGINNPLNLNAKVFVNADNQLTIVAPEKSAYTIYNVVGLKVTQGLIVNNSTVITELNSTGIFIVKLSGNNNDITTKVIIK